MPPPILKKGLFVRRSVPNTLLRVLNWLGKIFCLERKVLPIPQTPKKILLCNIAHFGDVVISTNVLPIIKKHFPHCEIGFLTGTEVGKNVLQNHPLIARLHFFDHWYLERSNKYKAALHHWLRRRRIVQEVRKANYEIAIDLYSYFPNAIPLLAKCGVPIRIGYPTGGFSSLLTHSIKWEFADRYVGYAHLHLLKVLKIKVQRESPLPFYNFKQNESCSLVVHMGSSSPLKEWQLENWIKLIQLFRQEGWEVLLTGRGKRERENCDQVAAQTGAKNQCDQLNWQAFVRTIQEARLLVSVDSVAVHIAAASSTPSVVLFAGMSSPKMWLPPTPLCKGVTFPVSCFPCFQRKGCSEMTCIQKISVEDVYRKVRELL